MSANTQVSITMVCQSFFPVKGNPWKKWLVQLVNQPHKCFFVETIIIPEQRRQWHPTPVLLPGKSPSHGGAWWAAVHGVAKSRTRLSDFTFTFHFHALEKEMATRSSVLAWRIPGTGEPGGLPSMGSHRVGHAWSDLAAAAEKNKPSATLDALLQHPALCCSA